MSYNSIEWKRLTTPDGQVYYQNNNTKETTWDAPHGIEFDEDGNQIIQQISPNPYDIKPTSEKQAPPAYNDIYNSPSPFAAINPSPSPSSVDSQPPVQPYNTAYNPQTYPYTPQEAARTPGYTQYASSTATSSSSTYHNGQINITINGNTLNNPNGIILDHTMLNFGSLLTSLSGPFPVTAFPPDPFCEDRDDHDDNIHNDDDNNHSNGTIVHNSSDSNGKYANTAVELLSHDNHTSTVTVTHETPLLSSHSPPQRETTSFFRIPMSNLLSYQRKPILCHIIPTLIIYGLVIGIILASQSSQWYKGNSNNIQDRWIAMIVILIIFTQMYIIFTGVCCTQLNSSISKNVDVQQKERQQQQQTLDSIDHRRIDRDMIRWYNYSRDPICCDRVCGAPRKTIHDINTVIQQFDNDIPELYLVIHTFRTEYDKDKYIKRFKYSTQISDVVSFKEYCKVGYTHVYPISILSYRNISQNKYNNHNKGIIDTYISFRYQYTIGQYDQQWLQQQQQELIQKHITNEYPIVISDIHYTLKNISNYMTCNGSPYVYQPLMANTMIMRPGTNIMNRIHLSTSGQCNSDENNRISLDDRLLYGYGRTNLYYRVTKDTNHGERRTIFPLFGCFSLVIAPLLTLIQCRSIMLLLSRLCQRVSIYTHNKYLTLTHHINLPDDITYMNDSTILPRIIALDGPDRGINSIMTGSIVNTMNNNNNSTTNDDSHHHHHHH